MTTQEQIDDLERQKRELQNQQREYGIRGLEQSFGTRERIVDLGAFRITFWEKLVILDGACLALSLSAFSALKQGHLLGHDGGIGYFRASWKCFLCSVCFALIAQWLTSLSMNAQYQTVFSIRRMLYHNQFKAGFGASYAPDEPEGKSEEDARENAKTADRIYGGTLLAGIIAGAFTVEGLCWLYRYVSVNLS